MNPESSAPLPAQESAPRCAKCGLRLPDHWRYCSELFRELATSRVTPLPAPEQYQQRIAQLHGAWNEMAELLGVKCWAMQQPRFCMDAVCALLAAQEKPVAASVEEWTCNYESGYWGIFLGSEVIRGKKFTGRLIGIAMTEKSANAIIEAHNAALASASSLSAEKGGL